jgi:very-short-patch-repair endonuclease
MADDIDKLRRQARTRHNRLRRQANENWIATHWRILGGPEYETEYRFHPTRKWRFDIAWPERKIALEIEGKGHAKFNRYSKDIEKYNAAAELDWRVFRISYAEIWSHDISVLETLFRLLDAPRRPLP